MRIHFCIEVEFCIGALVYPLFEDLAPHRGIGRFRGLRTLDYLVLPVGLLCISCEFIGNGARVDKMRVSRVGVACGILGHNLVVAHARLGIFRNAFIESTEDINCAAVALDGCA